MFKKGQEVQILPHERTRYIYQNSSVEPGRVTRYAGGQVGIIRDIYNDSGEASYVVEMPGRTPHGNDFREFSASELKS